MTEKTTYWVGVCPNCGWVQGQWTKNFYNSRFNCKRCDKKKKVYNQKAERVVKIVYVGCSTREAKNSIIRYKTLNRNTTLKE